MLMTSTIVESLERLLTLVAIAVNEADVHEV
jgi:hypothetical protein